VAKAWIQVRLTRETMSLLQLCKGWFQSDRSSAPAKNAIEIDRFGLSMDAVVRELIRRELAHRGRSARSSQKRREARTKGIQTPMTATTDNQPS
jgi:hypothetical protein